jgi:hypothetical protein
MGQTVNAAESKEIRWSAGEVERVGVICPSREFTPLGVIDKRARIIS